MDRIEPPLHVGETVVFRAYPASTVGVITERPNEDYVRVMWADSSEPTTHHCRFIRRLVRIQRAHQARPSARTA
jgi:hypothetical protein